ncbi:cilia- and flagella-associated protein 52-like [Anneissia japonica]|uniref:cilia- and flagella-associated protein 52-like n=1 Tax=Anneissia japonica TaxID=1529436 RepID=UPI0014256050|nr:cilia- and flagella-associated protein 52-like [Anneissia japonica]
MAGDVGADVQMLELKSVIGFNGSVHAGLKVHPDRENIVYPLGNVVIIEHIQTHKQSFLTGHTNDVSCLAISKSGRYIASGQITHMGFKADLIIWNYETKDIYCRLSLHKVKVQSLAFSPNEKYLLSLGGQDDGCVVIWDVKTMTSICGSPAALKSAGMTYCVAYSNLNDNIFVTGGDRTLRVWELDRANRKIRPTDCTMGQLKRVVRSIEVSEDDKFFYCGTTSGDVLQVSVDKQLFRHYGPAKNKYSLGITALALVKTGEILVGAGDGTVALIKGEKFQKVKSTKIQHAGEITSIALRGHGHQFFVGTSNAQTYRFNFAEFTFELINTCHYKPVRDIVFPFGCSDIFATCSENDIRIWKGTKEALRITVPNITCHAINFMQDGKYIISAWNDGKIRAFLPESGRLLYCIEDAHNKGVTAIASTSDCMRIVSGGGEGQVRVWKVSSTSQRMEEAMKEHKGSVSSIKVRKNNEECISASSDGTCIIWDLIRFVRIQVIFANTLFMCVLYHPDEMQVITSGTDRKIGYWESINAAQIREVEGSQSGSVNGMDIASDGEYFATGGDDKLIKVWNYKEAEVTHVGIGHSGFINRLKICPNQKIIVSVSDDGAILFWNYPFKSSR